MKSFKIVVKKWLRGNKHSVLRNEAGGMCCLGHLAKAHGAKNEDIFLRSTPRNVDSFEFPKGILSEDGYLNATVTTQLMKINDEIGFTLSERKKKLTKLFAQINLKPIFK